MSQDLKQRRRRIKRERRRSQAGLVRAIIACVVGILVLTAGILVWNGVTHRHAPDPVEGLSAQVCYHDVALSWDPVRGADGYVIYQAVDDGGEPAYEKIQEIADGSVDKYEVVDYPHDQQLLYRVAAYREDMMKKDRKEGEPSEAVPAMYDSSQYAQKIPVLTYHELAPKGYAVHTSLIVPEDRFEEQMNYLKENDFKTLTMDEFYRWHEGKLEVPVKSCVITFDDGADNVYYLAYPILKRNDQAATVFCIGHHLEENGGVTAPYTPEDGESRRFCKDVVEELRADYPKLACESHTYNMHKRIDGHKPVNVLSYEEMKEDFQKNEPYGFHYMAYPWGASNHNMRKATKTSGYRLAFGYGPFRYATREDNPYRVHRIKVNGLEGLDSFIEIVSGDRPDDAEEK